jgi:hypothetical protein
MRLMSAGRRRTRRAVHLLCDGPKFRNTKGNHYCQSSSLLMIVIESFVTIRNHSKYKLHAARPLVRNRQSLSWSTKYSLLWNLKFHCLIHKILPLGLAVCQLNQIYTFACYSVYFKFILILLSHIRQHV